jgi:hypothetical protein
MARLLIALGFFCELSCVPSLVLASEPSMREVDQIRIGEAYRLADAIGNKVWPEWDKAPFAILLVTPDHEFLIGHPKPTSEFTALGEDTILKQKIWWRKRQFSPKLLATFPAVGGVPTIVVGQAENTESKTSTEWVITLLHEHFHQLQNSKPRYFADVDSLGLSRGDQSGMWMLNYPFPYAKPEVKQLFSQTAKVLTDALHARDRSDFAEKFAAYVEARNKLRELLDADDWKYFGFQLWQEGIARYTEYHVATTAATDYEPGKAFRELKDFVSYKDAAKSMMDRIEKNLASVELDKAKRVAVYSFGAAEGLVLDRARPEWRKRYFEDRFTLDGYFQSAK